MNTQNAYQSLHQTSSSLAARAGQLLGRWMEVSGVHDVVDGFAAGAVSAKLTACEAATGFSGKDGGWELAFHRTIMMDIRGVNP